MSDRIAELEASLAAALERIDALERGTAPTAVSAPATEGSTGEAPAISAEPTEPRIDRRRLLTRGGTAAAGAVLGGVAATIATAAPAAAATGSFDTSTSTPALSATTSGTGPAVLASSASTGQALHADGLVEIAAPGLNRGLRVFGGDGVRPGIGAEILASGIGILTSGANMGVLAAADGLTSTGVLGHGGLGYGVTATGARANILMKAPGDPYPPMPDPTTGSTAHQKGELYWSDDSVLWVCIADGTPGLWRRATGAGTAGALTMLATPTRVYDTRANSGLPGAGTGPVSGVRHDIDLSGAVPVDATAALVTLTVTNTVANANAYGQIFANGLVTPPSTSSVNWTAADSLVATTTTTALTAGKVAISMNPGANVLIDVLGYYR